MQQALVQTERPHAKGAAAEAGGERRAASDALLGIERATGLAPKRSLHSSDEGRRA